MVLAERVRSVPFAAAMPDTPEKKRGRTSRWGEGLVARRKQPGDDPAAATPGAGAGAGGAGGAANVPPPSPPPGANVATTRVPPPPPPPGAGVANDAPIATMPSGASAMSVEAAKAAAAKAAAAIQAQLGMPLGYADVDAAPADPALYPGMPEGWGAGMNEPQRQTAYAQHTRQARRLYIGGIPPGAINSDVQRFLNDLMLNSGAAINPAAGPPVVDVKIQHEKGFGFAEFTNCDDAQSALMFDGVVYGDTGRKIRVNRPRDYDPSKNPVVIRDGLQIEGPKGIGLLGEKQANAPPPWPEDLAIPAPPPLVSEWPKLPKRTPDGPNKLYVGGFDPLHTEGQIRQVLQAIGELKSFCVMPDARGRNTGHVFCEFADPRLTVVAEEALTGAWCFRQPIVCKRAMPDAAPAKEGDAATYAIPDIALPLLEEPNEKLWAYNVVCREHCEPDDVVADVVEVVRRECAAVSGWDVESVIAHVAPEHGDKRISLEFEEGGGGASGVGGTALEAAVRCSSKMNGRTFEGRTMWFRYVPQSDEEWQRRKEREGVFSRETGAGKDAAAAAAFGGALPPPPVAEVD